MASKRQRNACLLLAFDRAEQENDPIERRVRHHTLEKDHRLEKVVIRYMPIERI